MTVQAVVTHQSSGRLRVRVPSQRNNKKYFERVRADSLKLQGVKDVHTNAKTGGILFRYDGKPETLYEKAQSSELFSIAHEPDKAAIRPSQELARSISSRFKKVDKMILRWSAGRVDLPIVAFATLGAAGVMRALRGDIWPAALPLLGWAFDSLGSERRGRAMAEDQSI